MEGRIYVPNSKKLKEKILQENYNSVDVVIRRKVWTDFGKVRVRTEIGQ